MMTIGPLSKRTGVNIETSRYYERIGLLCPALRTETRRRVYESGDIRRLTFIRHARNLEFDIAAIKTMLALQEAPEASCKHLSRMATDQLVAVESRIRRLLRLKTALSRMIKECDNGKVANCRIVEVLAEAPASQYGQEDHQAARRWRRQSLHQ